MFIVKKTSIIYALCISVLIFSCKRKWTENDRTEFISGCMNGGAVSDMGKEKAREYCQCMLEKIIAKYPNRRDANYIRYDTSLAALATECSKHR